MTWDAALKQQVQANSNKLCVLFEVELTTPTAQTVRFSDIGYYSNAIIFPPMMVSASPILERATAFSGDIEPYSVSFEVPTQARFPHRPEGTTVADMLAAEEWDGAQVTISVLDQSLNFTPAQVFIGFISRIEVTPERTSFHCFQSREYNATAPPTEITSTSYPQSGDSWRGLPLPILIGDLTAINMRSPHPSPYANLWEQWLCGGGRPSVKGVLVDPGLGSAKAKILWAGHRIANATSDKTAGRLFGMDLGSDVLSILEDQSTAGSGITDINTATEAGFTIDDEKLIAYTAIVPSDVRFTGTWATTGTNPRNAIGAMNEVDFALIDAGSAAKRLTFVLPSPGSLGTIISVQVYLCVKGRPGTAGNIQVCPSDPSAARGTILTFSANTLGQVVVYKGTWDAAWWTQQWDFGTAGHGASDLTIDMHAAGAAGQVEVYWAALVVKHRVNLSTVTPGRGPGAGARPLMPNDPRGRERPFQVPAIPAITELATPVMGTQQGLTDTAGGDYTGTPSALVEKAGDVVKALLCEFANASPSDFLNTAGVFGNFTDIRNTARAFQPDSMRVGFQLTEFKPMGELLADICGQTGLKAYMDPEDGLWKIFPWRDGDAVSYSERIHPDWIKDISSERTSDIELVQGVKVSWYKDVLRSRNVFDCYATSIGSGRGYTHPEFADEACEVTSSNQWFDYLENATVRAVSLTIGVTTPIALAADLQAKIIAVRGNAAFKTWVGHGCTVSAGHNDDLTVTIGGVTTSLTVPAGEYTPHTLAEKVQDTLNAAGLGRTWTVTYSDASNQFSISATGGSWTIVVVAKASSVWPVMGIGADQTLAAAAIAAVVQPRYHRHIWWVLNGWTMTPNIGTGANAANGCAKLLGFTTTNRVAATQDQSIWQTGDIQQQCAALRLKFHKFRLAGVDGWAIRHETVAMEARRRVFYQRNLPRLMLRFTTDQTPDLKLGMVFKVHEDMARIYNPPSYGITSWDGLRFRVIERSRSIGPAHVCEFRAIQS